MYLNATLLWLAGWSTLLLAVGMLRGSLPQLPVIKLLLAPGFIVDSVLRVVAALVSGTKVQRINVLRRGPLVELGRSPIRHIGPALFVSTRLFLLFVGLYYFLAAYPDLARSTLHLPIFDLEALRRGEFDPSAIDRFLDQLRHLPSQLKVHRLQGWLLVYLCTSMLISTALTPREYIAAIYTVVMFHVAAFACAWIGVTFGFLSRGQLIGVFYSEDFWACFSLLVLLTVAALICLIPVRILRWLLPPRTSTAQNPAAASNRPR